MVNTVRFGVLGCAKIALEKMIPALQGSSLCEVTAIASRNAARAAAAARSATISRHYGSYEALLADPELDAIYIPLPNHLHTEWSLKCLKAGKHVLCEKPLGMSAEDTQALQDATTSFPGLKVMEAFMYLSHPRWIRALEVVRSGELGEIAAVHSFFSYYNDDPANYRNRPELGGGGLMDVGCYCISVARQVFGREPVQVSGVMKKDPHFGVDRLTSGLLDFESGTSVFTCSTQSVKEQYVKIIGTKGKLEIEWPFNPDFSKPQTLLITSGEQQRREEFAPCDHFRLQGDAFARSVLFGEALPISLEDSVRNMAVIDRVKRAAHQHRSV